MSLSIFISVQIREFVFMQSRVNKRNGELGGSLGCVAGKSIISAFSLKFISRLPSFDN